MDIASTLVRNSADAGDALPFLLCVAGGGLIFVGFVWWSLRRKGGGHRR